MPSGAVSGRQALSWRSARQKRRYSRGMDLVEARLQAAAAGYPGALGDACRATLAAGGKRVRPLLALPFADDEFAAVTVGWGVRNVPDVPRA
ncbi:MAG TPA: class I SAM-dependent methyltransferase, partial [Solirubrobacteraceae bacterium]